MVYIAIVPRVHDCLTGQQFGQVNKKFPKSCLTSHLTSSEQNQPRGECNETETSVQKVLSFRVF